MKSKMFNCLVLLVLASIAGCKDCDLNSGDCKNGGTYDDQNCRCNCPPGFEGNDCGYVLNQNRMHAEISYDGATFYSYDPPDLDVKVLDHILTDTLWIDGYDDVKGSYCFMRLYITDHNSIKVGDEFQIEGGNALGTCWASFLDPDQDPNAYTVLGKSNGKLKITTYQPGTKIAGSFEFDAYKGSSVVHVTGWFED